MKISWGRWLKTLTIIPITALLLTGMTPLANATTVQAQQIAVAPAEITDPNLIAPEDYQLLLSTTNGEQFFTNPWSGPIMNAKLNYSFDTEEYRIFIVDMTTEEVIGASGAIADEGYAVRTEFNFGDPHQYQAFYSKYTINDYNDVTNLSQLTDVLATSNVVTLTRSPWKVEIYPLGEEEIQVDTTLGGGSYGTYLVNENTGQIIWNDIERNQPLFAPNPYLIEDDSWATAYVARDFRASNGGNGIKPLVKSDLLDIQATSRKYTKPSGAATSSTKEIAGGVNPSVPCSQDCQADPINMSTGEFFLNEMDLSTPGVGLHVSAQRSYSITNKDVLGVLGNGWSGNSLMSIASPNNMANLVDETVLSVNQENGSAISFYKNPNGLYETGSAVQATLSYDATAEEFTLLRGKVNSFKFSKSGKLKKQEDQFGSSISYVYNGDKLVTETDSNGNVLTYTYANNLLTKISDNNGQNVLYAYNVNKKLLTQVTDSTGVIFKYTYDTAGRMKTLTNALGGITTNTYDYVDRVTQQKDPLGRLIKFSYDGEPLNQMVTITQADNSKSEQSYQNGQLVQNILNAGTAKARKWSYYYGATNQVISAIGPDGSIANMTYDDNGNTLTSTDALRNKTTYTYNGQNKVLTATDALGHVSTNAYDAVGNLSSSTDALGNRTTFAYNVDNTLAKVTDARGNAINANPDDYTTSFTYGAKGLLSETTDALGNKTQNAYDSLGRMTSTTDPLGNIGGVSYNALNLPAKVTDPLLNETMLTYDNMGNGLTSKDALGSITTYTYDLVGNLLTSKDALNQITTYVYDKMNRVISITDAKGKISSIKYDTSGRVIETTDALLQVTKNEWDVRDNLIATIDAMSNKTTYTYDRNGNLLTVKTPLGAVTSYVYDKLGNMVRSTDAENRVTKLEYDALGRVVKTIAPDNSFTMSAYDSIGNIVTTTDALGKSCHYEYDNLGRKVKYTDEVGSFETYTYDAGSHMVTKTRVDGSLVNYVYDATNALTDVDYPGAEADIAYTYDAMGRKITEQKANDAVVSYAYDVIGQLKNRGPPTSKVAYEYDAVGNQTKLTYPSGRVVTNVYDDNSQLKTLNTAGIANVTYDYDSRGHNTASVLPNQVTQENTYDADNQLSKQALIKDAGKLFENSFAYNKTGEITQQGKTGTAVTVPSLSDYTYDPLSRINGVLNNSATVADNDYSHDSVGNLVLKNGVNQTFNDAGRLLTSGATTLSYDTRGNRLNDTVTTSTWGIDNTLASIQKGADNVAYTYDANGLLQKRSVNNAVTNDFIWDMNGSLPLLLNDGEYEYVYSVSRIPLAQIKISTGAVTYPVTDTNGSVTALIDSNGSMSPQVAYTAYGEPTGTLSSNLGYAGEWTDKLSGETYNRARWYDTNTGVFLSVDPLTQSTGQAYGYTDGNPLQQIDPLGLCSWGGLLHIGSDCYKFMDSNGFQNTSDFTAAFGDSASFGGTDAIRELAGVNSVVGKCSGYYTAGGITGDIATIFIPGGGVAKAGGTTIKKSFKNFWKDFKEVRKDESGDVALPNFGKGDFQGKIERVNVGKDRGVTKETLNALVKHHGFRKTKERSHGQPIFKDSKGKHFYSRDMDDHNGGVFKGSKKGTENDFTKKNRSGTYDENLKEIGE